MNAIFVPGRGLGLPAAVALLAVCIASAEAPAQPDAAEREEHAARMKTLAKSVHIYRTPDRKSEVDLAPDPVLRYADSTRRIYESSLWIWGPQGRPAAIVAIEYYKEQDRAARWLYEIASLSPERIAVERNGDVDWTAAEPGLQLEGIAGAAPPAETPVRRLAQMKELQRRFSAHEHTLTEGRIQLRPLTRPLHRYEDAAQQVVDGAIFSFANGTNPEVLLVLEASASPGAAAQWKFALAQLTGASVSVERDGEEVWRRDVAYPPSTRPSYKNGWIAEDADR